jgi:hypothetical protein
MFSGDAVVYLLICHRIFRQSEAAGVSPRKVHFFIFQEPVFYGENIRQKNKG